MDEARFWNRGRSLRWVGLFLLMLIGMPVALGFVSAHLDHIDPATGWRGIGRVVAMALFAIITLVGIAWLWRDYRRHLGARETGAAWQHQATTRTLKVSGVWRDCMIVGFIVGFACAFATQVPPGPVRLALAAVAGLALTGGIVRGTLHYMRTIDDHERDANLWSAYCGMSVYLTLFMAQYLAARFGIVMPHVHEAIFLVSAGVLTGVFLWKRFR